MSSALALAAVTAVLKDQLNTGLIDQNVSAVVGNVSITALPPDRAETQPGGPSSQLNLFLYQVTPNPGWRNEGLPVRNAAGERVGSNPLALDLHYLLTAYGAEELHAEILLGFGMQLLHETPVLSREGIRRSLRPPGGGGGSPAAARLFTAELAEQVEQIKVTPAVLSSEEISKLWSAFQARYRPTVAYQASVVLIESRRPTRSALPVRGYNVYVLPLARPTLTAIASQATSGDPIVSGEPILSGHQLVLQGSQLAGGETLVSLDGLTVAPAAQDMSDTQVIVAIPASLPAGVHGAQVVHRRSMGTPPAPHRGVESNVLPFLLSPHITGQAVGNVQGSGPALRSAEVGLTVTPAVGATQRAALLMNELQPPAATHAARAFSFEVPPRIDLQDPPATLPPPAPNLTVPIAGVPDGTYLIRVQVDGAVSPLAVDANRESATFNRFTGPTVVIP